MKKLRDHGVEERTMLDSFDLSTLLAIRAHGFRGRTNLSKFELYTGYVPGALHILPMRGEIAALPVEYATEKNIRRLRRAGLTLHFWGVNDLAGAERLVDLGVGIIETDYPERLTRLLGRSIGSP
jgi:glycerophosphoryl diester phosphodiesterase